MTAGAIVMKYGMNLRKKGEEGPLPEELTTFGAARAAEGLAYLDEHKWCKLDPDVADRVMPIALAAIREITQRHGREEALGSIGID
jgi:hypothetical protein